MLLQKGLQGSVTPQKDIRDTLQTSIILKYYLLFFGFVKLIYATWDFDEALAREIIERVHVIEPLSEVFDTLERKVDFTVPDETDIVTAGTSPADLTRYSDVRISADKNAIDLATGRLVVLTSNRFYSSAISPITIIAILSKAAFVPGMTFMDEGVSFVRPFNFVPGTEHVLDSGYGVELVAAQLGVSLRRDPENKGCPLEKCYFNTQLMPVQGVGMLPPQGRDHYCDTHKQAILTAVATYQ